MSGLLTAAGVFTGAILLHETAHAIAAKLYGVATAVAIVHLPGRKALLCAGPAILATTDGDTITRRDIVLSLAPLLWLPIAAATAYLQFQTVTVMLGIAAGLTLFSDAPALAMGGVQTDSDLTVRRIYEFRNPGVFSR